MNPSIKQAVSNEIWLNYFNQILFEKNLITEAERNKMKNMISLKCRAPIIKKIIPSQA